MHHRHNRGMNHPLTDTELLVTITHYNSQMFLLIALVHERENVIDLTPWTETPHQIQKTLNCINAEYEY